MQRSHRISGIAVALLGPIVMCGGHALFSGYAWAQKADASTSGPETAQLVGLVYDKDSRPGDQVTASLTADPKKYENIPALGVIEMRVPAARGETAQATLQGLIVDLGDGRQQPANQPVTIQIPQNATGIPVILHQQGKATPAAQGSVPVNQGPSPPVVTNTGKASDFTTPPVVQTTSIIHGPLSGNGSATRIMVDNQPASIIAETPRAVVFNLPPGAAPGSHTLTLQDGQRAASAPIVKMALLLNAGQLTLQKGQSTNYTATVQLGPLPDSVWQHGGGSSPELAGPSGKLEPNFHVPQAGEPAVVFFYLENGSRQTVTIKPNDVVTRMLHQQDFEDGQFTQAGVAQSKRSGAWVLNAVAQAFFAPISCNELNPAAAGERPIADVNTAQSTAPGTPPVLFVPSGGATLATAKADGWGGDGFKDKYPGRTFLNDGLKICKNQNCGNPQELETKEKKKMVYCKKDDKCGQGDKECPKASCHIVWSFIDGAKGSKPTGDPKTDKDNKERNEKWQSFERDTSGSGDGTGVGKENAVPKDRKASDKAKVDDYAYSCVCY